MAVFSFNNVKASTAPTIISTIPINNSKDQKVNDPIIVNFSQPMDPDSVSFKTNPTEAYTKSWSNNNMTLTLSHPAFRYRSYTYIATVVSGQASEGDKLYLDPYTWNFITEGYFTAPTNTSISINNGEKIASSQTVNLSLSASGANYMMISNNGDFTGGQWEAYSASKSWLLASGNGDKSVYVKFKDNSGNESARVIGTITLSVSTQQDNPISTSADGDNGQGKEAVNVSISIVPPPLASVFTRNLKMGDYGDDVMELQKLLNNKGFLVAQSGFGSKGNESRYFGQKTKYALSKYQANFKISPSLGYFGPITRKFIIDYQ